MTKNESKYGKVVIVGGGRNAGRTMQAQVELLARIDELEAYRAIGTVEELKQAKAIYNEILLSEAKSYFPKECIAYEVGKLMGKELREYRAIGTPTKILEKIGGLDVELGKYHEIGTVEEFKFLKEKSVAKKPILNNPKINEFYVKEAKLCPVCHSYINNCSGDYCRDCGQRIDWSE